MISSLSRKPFHFELELEFEFEFSSLVAAAKTSVVVAFESSDESKPSQRFEGFLCLANKCLQCGFKLQLAAFKGPLMILTMMIMLIRIISSKPQCACVVRALKNCSNFYMIKQSNFFNRI